MSVVFPDPPPMDLLPKPTWRVDTLVVENGNYIDDLGRWWTVNKHPDGEDGWESAPAPRTARTARPAGIGSFRSVAYAKERTITLAGQVLCPSVELREQTAMELAAVCSDPGRLYPYRRTTSSYDLTVDVERDDQPLIKVTNPWRLDWSFQFAAPDPRKHDYAWQEPQATLGADSGGGLDASGAGLDASGAGLDAGAPAKPAAAAVGNYGTAPAKPLLALYGALANPTIVHVESGASVTYAGSTAVGETLFINCDDFAQRDIPGRACISTVRGSVRPLLTIGVDWPVVNPQDTATFQLIAPSGDPGARLGVALRSAWW